MPKILITIISLALSSIVHAATYTGDDSFLNFSGTFGTSPFNLELSDVPSNSLSSGVLTIEALGDFSFFEEYLEINIEGYSLGKYLNSNPNDDIFNNSSFNDVGNDYENATITSANIPITILNQIISDGVITITIDPSFRVEDYIFFGRPQEYVTISLSYEIEDVSIPSIPIPSAIWLFSSGFVSLLGLSRLKNSA